jgi:hypothetical protein
VASRSGIETSTFAASTASRTTNVNAPPTCPGDTASA